jgi:hypothetical protein
LERWKTVELGAKLPAMAEIVGKKAIEDAAIAWVIDLERAAGREARDTRHRGAPADIESPPRVIEVKAFGKSNRGFGLSRHVRSKRRDETETSSSMSSRTCGMAIQPCSR